MSNMSRYYCFKIRLQNKKFSFIPVDLSVDELDVGTMRPFSTLNDILPPAIGSPPARPAAPLIPPNTALRASARPAGGPP